MNRDATPGRWQGFRGIGPKLAERLAALGIERPEALLTHVPLRYEDRTRVTPIGSLVPGDQVLVVGEILVSEVVRGRRSMLLVRLADGTGYVTARFFHFHARMRQAFARGSRYACFGEVRAGGSGFELVHPTMRRVPPDGAAPVEATLTPVYPAVGGLSQTALRRAVDQAQIGRAHV